MKKQWIIGALVATSALQAALPAYASREGVGQMLGMGAGALIGNQFGGGSGRVAATVIGAIAGSVIGGKIGREMDEADRRAFYEAQRYCFSQSGNSSQTWSGRKYGSRTNARGTFATTRQGYHYQTNEVCHEYRSHIYVNGREENMRGIACRRSDGSFYEVNNTEVRYGRSDTRAVLQDSDLLLDNGIRSGDRFDRDSNGMDDRYDRSPRHENDRYDHDDRMDQGDRYDRDADRGRYDRDDRMDRGDRYDRPRGGQQNPRLPAPPGRGGIITPIPAPPPSQVPAPGSGSHYPASADIHGITRLTGGGWYRVSFDRPVSLSSIRLQVRGAGLKLYDTVVVTDSGLRLLVPELSNTSVLYSNSEAAGFFNRPERVTAIDIRAESFRGTSSLSVQIRSPEVSPSLRPQSFVHDFR